MTSKLTRSFLAQFSVSSKFDNIHLLRQESLGREHIGLIKLIPKEPIRDMVGGWRPITLCNVLYKVLTKSLAKRIESNIARIV